MKKMGLFDNDGPTMDADLSVLSDDASVGNGVTLENATDVELNVLDFDSLDLDSLKSESKELDSMDFDSLDLDSLKSESKEEKYKENSAAYDAAFKRIFSRKRILAAILLNIIPEYKGLDVSEVEGLIIEDPLIDSLADLKNTEEVGFSKKIIYDIVIMCKYPNSKKELAVDLIFDLEMQMEYNMNYSIVQRAIYYASRKLAAQLHKKQNYSDLVPVYSAWICLHDVPKSLQNSVYSFRFSGVNSNNVTNLKLEQEAQLINVDLILLSEQYDWNKSDEPVIKFVQAILKNNLTNRDFNPYIEPDSSLLEEVQIIMSKEEEFLEIYNMHEQRVKEAEEEAELKGREKGRLEGKEDLIATCISNSRELHQSEDYIKDTLVNMLGLTSEQAKMYLEKY